MKRSEKVVDRLRLSESDAHRGDLHLGGRLLRDLAHEVERPVLAVQGDVVPRADILACTAGPIVSEPGDVEWCCRVRGLMLRAWLAQKGCYRQNCTEQQRHRASEPCHISVSAPKPRTLLLDEDAVLKRFLGPLRAFSISSEGARDGGHSIKAV